MNDIFSETERNETEKMLKNFFCLRRNILFWEFGSNPNKPNLAWPPKRIKLALLGSTA
jgi:hypothetical protein